MLTGGTLGIGEWGFAALIEADGQRLLIDTGARAETVLKNAAELGLDLSGVTDVVITHNHVTMSYASSLYGIHLDESGASHIVSVRLEDIRKPAVRAATAAQAG